VACEEERKRKKKLGSYEGFQEARRKIRSQNGTFRIILINSRGRLKERGK
jgi:hypothetical protein